MTGGAVVQGPAAGGLAEGGGGMQMRDRGWQRRTDEDLRMKAVAVHGVGRRRADAAR
jgi:hypothetical protein